MNLQYTFIVIDGRRRPGEWVEQDLTAVRGYDANRSELNSSRSAKPATSKAYLSFLIDTPNLNIYEEAEVWAGWRDLDTGRWYDYPAVPERLWGGYIYKIDKSFTEGSEKKLELTLIDYMHDPTSLPVLSWPNPETDPRPVGYPPGWSVSDWLVGTPDTGQPFLGILPAHMTNDVRLDGVDPIFQQIIFNEDTLPGVVEVGSALTIGIDGRFGIMMLDKVITAIADAAAWTWAKDYAQNGQDMRVAWWIEAAISATDPTKIVPRFRFANQADTGRADWTIATDPSPDPSLNEYGLIRDAYHSRDATGRMDRVIVRGIGFDQTIPGAPLPVMAEVSNPAHLAQYPTRYARTPGRATEIIYDTRLHTRALAVLLATRLETLLWGARGSLTQDVLAPIAQGDFVRYRNPNEALDRVYPCTDSAVVGGTAGSPHYRVTIGFNPPTLQDLIKGGLVDVLLTQQDLLFKTGQLPQRTMIGVPPQIPPEMTPTHPQRNAITPVYNDTPAVRVVGSTRARPTQPGDPPAPTSGTFEAMGADGIVRTWTGQDGAPHGHIFYMEFDPTNTPHTYVMVSSMSFVRVVYMGTGLVTFSDETGPLTLPFHIARGNHLLVTPSGVVDALQAVLTEIP